MTSARDDDDEWELAQDRNLGDGPEPGDQFGSAPISPEKHDALARRAHRTQSKSARRAAGRVRLEVWITPEQKRRLQWIRDEDGHDFATIVGVHIDTEYEERNPKR